MKSTCLGFCAVLALLTSTFASALVAPAQADTAARFVAAVNAADADALDALIHIDALAERVLAGMPPDAPQRATYRSQLRDSAGSLGATFTVQLRGRNARAKVLRAGPDGPLVRITLSQGGGNVGHNYYRLRLHEDGRIEDWYDYGMAMWTSDNMRFTSASVLSPADLALLVFRDREAVQAAMALRLVALHLSLGDHASAWRALQAIPEDLRGQRQFLTFSTVLSQAVGMDAYRQSLAEVARRHGDEPEMQLLLIDHYMLESKFDAMLDAVAAIERELGTDEVVLNNRCAALVGLKRYDEALAACDAVLAIDPKDDTALWTRVRMGLEKQDAALVVAALLRVEEATGERMDLERLSRREVYASVRDTPEFKALLASRAGE
jgi:PAS domain-containing protein